MNTPQRFTDKAEALRLMYAGRWVAQSMRIDMLNCEVSYIRMPCTATFEDILAIDNPNFHCTLNYRKSILSGDDNSYWELCYSVANTRGTDYFIWLQIHPKLIQSVLDELRTPV